jgi:3-hydroxyisobutyrate dehydrogenase-like beta-hydroxyacid dehydrogenase
MSDTIGFIGLGNLGLPMATNLVAAGHALRVYNRTASKAESLVARGVPLVARPVDTVTTGGVVVTVLWDEASVESVVTSDGFLERLGRGGVHISMSTVLPEAAKRLAEMHAAHGAIYLEAPVFGRPEAAVARKLWIPIAGERGAKERVRPLLEAMGGQGIFDFGEAVGAATTVKLVGNFLLISASRSLLEGLSVAEKAGVDPKAVLDMMTATLFPSPIYQSYGKAIVEKTATLGLSPIPLKDLGLFKRTAERVDSPTPMASRLYELVKGG